MTTPMITPMITLTDVQELEMLAVLRIMRQVVAEAGEDFVYEASLYVPGRGMSCTYVRNGEPDCLVGRILARMGVSLNLLKDMSTTGIEMAANVNFKEDLKLYPSTVDILTVAQRLQDNKESWGKCLQVALQVANERYGVTV